MHLWWGCWRRVLQSRLRKREKDRLVDSDGDGDSGLCGKGKELGYGEV